MMKRKSGAVVLGIAVMTILGSCGETTPVNESQQAAAKETVNEAVSSVAQMQETTAESMIEESEAESSQAEESSLAEESSAAEDVTDSDELLKPGFYWLVEAVGTEDGYRRSDTYYQFADDGTGYFVLQATGEHFTFEYTITGDELHIQCDNGFIEQQMKLTKNEDGTLDGTVDDDSSIKLYYQVGRDLAQFAFHSNDELCEMARTYYNASDGRECTYARAEIDADGNIILKLYEAYDGGEDRIDVYNIDRETAQGTDSSGNFVDLNSPPVH